MSDLNAAVQRVQEFASAEYDALQASYTANDAAEFDTAVQEANGFLHSTPGQYLTLTAGRHPQAGDTAPMREFAGQVTARKVLKARHYRHPQHGDLFAVYTSMPRKMAQLGYGSLFYLKDVDGALKIFAKYEPNMDYEDRIEWEAAGGAEIDDPGELVEEKKMQAPEMEPDRGHYESGEV